MSTKTYIKLIDQLLELSRPLKEQTNRPSPFLIVLTGTYRRAYGTVQAIRQLADYEYLSGSMFILVRSLLEDVVSIEYMLAGDAEEHSRRFAEYLNIQKYDDLKFTREHDPQAKRMKDTLQEIEEAYEAHKPHFLDKRKYVFKSWNNKLVGKMLSELKDNPAPGLDPEIIPWLAKLYLDGNRKAHFNPTDILPYLQDYQRHQDSIIHLNEGLGATIGLFCRLTFRYTVALQIITGDTQYDDLTMLAIKGLKKTKM